MSEYDDTDSDGGDVIDSFRNSFACLPKVKSNTPRARFDVHFYPTSIQLIQFNVQKKVSNRYRIYKDNVREMLRLPYSNGKQIFFVLHLKRPIVGGNKSTTNYDFVVFNFAQEEYEEISLELDNLPVKDMFDEDIVESGTIAGPVVEVFETTLTKIFGKGVTTPAIDYDGNNTAPALRCTFWDNDEHFLFPLDDGFINVWKYCQKIKLRELKNVRFVRSQGRSKTFDFYIYPKIERAIRRYHIGASKSNIIDCFFLEFKAIDQNHYDGLFAYCIKNKITISTNDFRQSASDTDSSNESGSDSQTPTETNASESDYPEEEQIDDDFEAPDPYMVQCQTEGRQNDSESSNTTSKESESTATSEDEVLEERARTSPEVSRITDDDCNTKQRRRTRSKNLIKDENESSSSDSVVAGSRKRRLRINSDDEIEGEIKNNAVGTATLSEDATSPEVSQVIDIKSSSKQRRRTRSRNVIRDENESSSSDTIAIGSRKRSLRIDSDNEIEDDIPSKVVQRQKSLIDVSESD